MNSDQNVLHLPFETLALDHKPSADEQAVVHIPALA